MTPDQMQLPPPEILLERGAVIVVRKPGGLLTQGPPGIDSLELRTKQFLKVRDEKPGKVYLGVPHRLDRPVSGVMVVVKNVRAAKRISEQIRNRTVKKTYWAMVSGDVSDSAGRWEDWMRKVPDEPRSELIEQAHPDAKLATLNYQVMGRTTDPHGEKLSWLEIELETGRTHQIRLQCGSRGFPIVGDQLYGSKSSFGPETTDLRKRWISLHARRLVFQHPIDKEAVDVTAELTDHWRTFEELEADLFTTGDTHHG
jgi:RluA family pseudouridine synthase